MAITEIRVYAVDRVPNRRFDRYAIVHVSADVDRADPSRPERNASVSGVFGRNYRTVRSLVGDDGGSR